MNHPSYLYQISLEINNLILNECTNIFAIILDYKNKLLWINMNSIILYLYSPNIIDYIFWGFWLLAMITMGYFGVVLALIYSTWNHSHTYIFSKEAFVYVCILNVIFIILFCSNTYLKWPAYNRISWEETFME